ncbi:MAG: molybdenum cofactor guanylyltransferase [Methylocystaceae bacterium]
MLASAVILAGGASTRMQTNKALVELFKGERMIDYVIGRLQPLFDDIVVVTNDPDLYTGIKGKVITDHYPRRGPLSGIHAGLLATAADKALVLACDMPFFSLELAQYMLATVNDWQAVVPVFNDRLQSLNAVYHRSVAMEAEGLLLEGHSKLRILFERINYRVLEPDELLPFGDPEKLFTNVNTKDSLEEARYLLGM